MKKYQKLHFKAEETYASWFIQKGTRYMKINIFKKGVKELNTAVDTYTVSWIRRYGQFHCDIEKAYQAFTNKEEAEKFAESIRRANELIGNTYGTKVTLTKSKNRLD